MNQGQKALLALAGALRQKADSDPKYRLDMFYFCPEGDESCRPCALGYGVMNVPEIQALELGQDHWLSDVFARKLEIEHHDFHKLFNATSYQLEDFDGALDPRRVAVRIEEYLEQQKVGLSITKLSPYTGKWATRFVPGLTNAMYDEAMGPRHERRLIQEIMPEVSAPLREFVMNGYTPEDWTAMFPPEEE